MGEDVESSGLSRIYADISSTLCVTSLNGVHRPSEAAVVSCKLSDR